MVPQPRSPTQTPVAYEAASTGVDVRLGGATTTVTGLEVGQGSGNIDKTPTMPHDSPLPRVNTLGSDEGKVQGRQKHDMESDFEFTVAKEVYTAEKGDSTAEPVSTCESLKNHCKFWHTATASTLDNGEMEITATIDEKVKIVIEASIKRHLKLEDSDGISNLPTTKIFKQLALMGRITRQESMVPQPRSPTQTPVVDEAASTCVDVRLGGATTTVTSLEVGHGSGNIDKTPTMPHDSPLPRVNILGSDEGKVQGRHKHDMESAFEFTVVEEVYTTEKGDSTAEPVSTCESLKNHYDQF
ncbi:hypothetical protein Tco_1419692 [Tanacetum coccineum]